VTATGQPVGLILDKSQGATVGASIVTGDSSTFTSGLGSWTGLNANVALTNPTARMRITQAGALGTVAEADLALTTVAGMWYRITLNRAAKSGTGAFLAGAGTAAGSLNLASVNAGTGTGQVMLSFAATGTTTYLILRGTTSWATNDYIEVDDVLVQPIPGNHALQATSTARPTLQQDASGFYYLSFDGVDDSLATGSINFTATDKMTVIAGAYKASDAARGILYELSADINSNNGAFTLEAPDAAAATSFRVRSKGTLAATAVGNSFAAPIAAVLTHQCDIGADTLSLRANGSQAATAATDQGTGNFGNFPLYVGRRGGSSLPFNGRMYSLIVRGAATSDPQLSQAERFIGARKMGLSF
jgi:hypothetical protein